MGTRCLTFVYDGDEVLLNMYRQFDGYPSGHGRELAEFLEGMEIVNGYNPDDKRKIANGMGCLAAQLIARFKVGVGGFYIEPPSAKDCGQDYEYHVTATGVRVVDYNGNEMFRGSFDQFKGFCEADD
jgi:hypothetical protein